MAATGFPQPELGGHKEPVWKEEKVLEWLVKTGGAAEVMLGVTKFNEERRVGDFKMGDVSKAYDEAREQIDNACDAYTKSVKKFRSEIKNDLASISASADRVRMENDKIKVAYEGTAATLSTPEMERAILNAERLATALKAISDLKNHSITFAVLDKKTSSGLT